MNKLFLVTEPGGMPPEVVAQLSANSFEGLQGQTQRLTQTDGSTHLYVGIAGEDFDFWTGAIACKAAHGLDNLELQNPQILTESRAQDFVLSWLLESYRFETFKPLKKPAILHGLTASERTAALVEGIYLTRSLINTPANFMNPKALQNTVEELGSQYGAVISVVEGEELKKGFPLIDCVGSAAGRCEMAPRLIEMSWGKSGLALTIVGKGITYDTGGLNLKPGSSMRLMKKDMGGAAHALGLAKVIMQLDLPIRLRVLIPAAENAIGPGAFRPGDVVRSRSGVTVEIDNTDAEGRLVLADALTYASEASQSADLTFTMATLTGAARVAVGPSIVPYLASDSELMWSLHELSKKNTDPIWPLPLFEPYEAYLDSDVADLVNSGGGGFAGAITAALFLKRFVGSSSWAHFDLYGWNPVAKPGRPKGAAAQGLLSLVSYLESWSNV